MYDSIKEWINVPFDIMPYVKRTGTGDIEYGAPIKTLCYPVDEIKLVRNSKGVEVISNTQLHIDGSVNIQILDKVVFDGHERPIQAISNFYRGGKIDIRVVYI